MSKAKFLKVKFLQSTELAGVGYSSVGGPERDGVYNSVPAEALEGWHPDALVKDGLIEVQGDGVKPEDSADKVEPAELAAFKASGMTEVQWLLLPSVERQALVTANADIIGRQKLAAGEEAIRKAHQANSANAVANTGNGQAGQPGDAAKTSAPAAKTVAKPAAKKAK